MGLAALVGTQLAQTALVGRRSPLVLLTAVASALVLVGVVQIPPLSLLFGCVPLDPVAWGVVLTAAVGATAAAVVLPPLVARMRTVLAAG
jgi:cation-transporting ATPase I